MNIHVSIAGYRISIVAAAAALIVAALSPVPALAQNPQAASTAPLRQGAGMTGEPSNRTRNVQRLLHGGGYDLGRSGIDGRFGPLTAAAVRRFQARAGLGVDGIVGVMTARALNGRASAPLHEGVGMGSRPSRRVRTLQRALMRGGFNVGRSGADGRFGPLTSAAVRQMQRTHHLGADGVVGARTEQVVRRLSRGARRAHTAAKTADRPDSRHRVAQRNHAVDLPPTPTIASAPSSEPNDTGTWRLIAAIASLCASAALATGLVTRRRRRSETTIVPIDRDVYLEGRSSAPDVADVRGLAIAAAVEPTTGPDDSVVVSYLVDDPRRPAPVWVRAEDMSRPVSGVRPGERVIGYVTVGNVAAHHREPHISAATRGLEELCAVRAWELQVVVDDDPHEDLLDRSGMRHALREISAGHAQALVMSDNASLAHPVRDIAMLLERLQEAEAALVIADLDLDTTTPAGRASASTLRVLAGGERDRSRPPAGVGAPAPRANEPDGRHR
jgi:peptidoglycan hydrolase-like protein with peptidoglycan-binding domain